MAPTKHFNDYIRRKAITIYKPPPCKKKNHTCLCELGVQGSRLVISKKHTLDSYPPDSVCAICRSRLLPPDLQSQAAENTFPCEPRRKNKKRKMSNHGKDEWRQESTHMNKLWNTTLEGHLLAVIRDWKSKEGAWVDGKLQAKLWKPLRNEFHTLTGKDYTVEQLQSKYFRLKEQFNTMKSILEDQSITGIGWNSKQCNIDCTPEQWEQIKKKKPMVTKNLRGNRSLPHYNLMADIFWDSGAQGAFSRSSKELPLTDEEENEAIAREMSPGGPIPFPKVISLVESDNDGDGDVKGMSTDKVDRSASKRKSGSTSVYDRSMSSDKRTRIGNPNDDVIRFALQTWTERQRMKMDNMQASSVPVQNVVGSNAGPCIPSVQKCMEILLSLVPNITGDGQIAALQFFQNTAAREAWVSMNDTGRIHMVSNNFGGLQL